MFISHTKVSGVGDSADATLVQPSDWNAAHTITGLDVVTDYGATGDGSTDDTAALQAALDAATGVVFFPPGTYITTGITVATSDLVLEGARGATIKLDDGITPARSPVTVSGNRVTIQGLTIDGNRAALSSQALTDGAFLVNGAAADDLTVQDCTLKNSAGHGIYVNTGRRTHVLRNTFDDISLIAVYFLPSAQSNNQMVVQGNVFTSIGMYVVPLGHSGRSLVSDNLVYGTSLAGLTVNVTTTAVVATAGSFATLMAGNFLIFNGGTERQIASIESTTELTLSATGGSETGVAAVGGTGDLIGGVGAANHFYNNTLIGGASLGISLSSDVAGNERAYANEITGNIIFGMMCSGISLQPAEDTEGLYGTAITGNTIMNCGIGGGAVAASVRVGIVLTGAGNRLTWIDGNLVFSTTGTTTTYWLGLSSIAAGQCRVGANTTDSMVNYGISGTGDLLQTLLTGAGTPESAVVAQIGAVYMRTDGSTDTTMYVKESGTGNTGWVAK